MFVFIAIEFQSTHPLRGATMRSFIKITPFKFQSTHPLRGATPHTIYNITTDRFQSTHPLRGATCNSAAFVAEYINFNPRTPCGVRPPRPLTRNAPCAYFNPRTPCGVRRRDHGGWRCGESISIHAPLAGCDYTARSFTTANTHFNPRTPCGVRPGEFPTDGAEIPDFNPRTPCGVRRHVRGLHAHRPGISIHAPLAGCDLLSANLRGLPVVFQSMHPLRGATSAISWLCTAAAFQSTHPLRGATCSRRYNTPARRISIHAPLAGCDRCAGLLRISHSSISIHAPLAGCDGNRARRTTWFCHFNPRTPCGVRHSCNCSCYVFDAISIHAPLAGCD